MSTNRDISSNVTPNKNINFISFTRQMPNNLTKSY